MFRCLQIKTLIVVLAKLLLYIGQEYECSCGTECKAWKDEGLYCIYTQPLTLLQSCNRTGYCDTGLMCKDGVCVRADKYNLNKWNKPIFDIQQNLK